MNLEYASLAASIVMSEATRIDSVIMVTMLNAGTVGNLAINPNIANHFHMNIRI